MKVRLVAHCLFVLVVCLSATARLLAQGEAAVHGTVTARADGSAVPGAIVELQGAALPAPMRVATGADGHFAFARLVPGEYVLTGRFLAPMDQTHTLTSGVTYRHDRTRLWGALSLEYGSGTPGGHDDSDHAHEDGEAHEHASGPGLCGTRCPSHFTQNVSIGWNASPSGSRPHMSFQFTVENLSNTVYLLSKESTMVQGQYSIPRLLSGSLKKDSDAVRPQGVACRL